MVLYSLTLVFQVDSSKVYVRGHLSLQLQLLIISEKKSNEVSKTRLSNR